MVRIRLFGCLTCWIYHISKHKFIYQSWDRVRRETDPICQGKSGHFTDRFQFPYAVPGYRRADDGLETEKQSHRPDHRVQEKRLSHHEFGVRSEDHERARLSQGLLDRARPYGIRVKLNQGAVGSWFISIEPGARPLVHIGLLHIFLRFLDPCAIRFKICINLREGRCCLSGSPHAVQRLVSRALTVNNG